MLDFDEPENNDWLAVNQFTVVEEQARAAAPDVVLFVNGLPLAVIELKNAADENATIWSAFNQLQTYKAADPGAVRLQRGAGHLGRRAGAGRHADRRPERFMPWRTIDGRGTGRRASLPQLEVLLEGVFDKRRFLDLIRYFIVFEDAGGGVLSRRWPAITSSTP